MNVREATENDLAQLLQVQRAAFDSETEAGLVQAMLADPTARPLLSLLAVEAGRTLGHVLFTRAGLAASDTTAEMAILAPLAVVPEAQGKGAGSRLVETGLERLNAAGIACALVLGDPAYYQRFGFTAATAQGLLPPYPLPEVYAEAWMARRLGNAPATLGGTVICCESLMRPELWGP